MCILLSNLKCLKDAMVSKEWTICSFVFEYKKIEYIVLVKKICSNRKTSESICIGKIAFYEK